MLWLFSIRFLFLFFMSTQYTYILKSLKKHKTLQKQNEKTELTKRSIIACVPTTNYLRVQDLCECLSNSVGMLV